jgi:hypothetical protein
MHVNERHGLSILIPSILALASACGGGNGSGGGGGGGAGGPTNGFVSFTMTDLASQNIESFQVDVTALALESSTGSTVSVISAPITVDLAALTGSTQLMNLLSVPAGEYTSATITLDFTNAKCVLIGGTSRASVVDDSGAPITGTLALPIQFGQSALTLSANTHRLVEFDVALDESAVVDTGTNSVTLEPTLIFRANGSGKILFTMGELVSVDTVGATFVGDIGSLHGGVLGNVTYTTNTSTIFRVDGATTQGAPGVTLLGLKAAGTWIQVFGAIDPASSHIAAQLVEAGVGTYNGGSDFIEGHITDRLGNPSAGSNVTFSVLGRSDNAAHDTFQYSTNFTVETNFTNTHVARRFSVQPFNTDALNVGQRVRIFGSLNGTTMNAAAQSSVVVAQETRMFGGADTAVVSGTLTIDLSQVDFRPQNIFMWPHSGATPPTAATFTADAGSLGSVLGIASGTPVEVDGFMAPVTNANQDMTATALINWSSAPSLAFIKNLAGGLAVDVTAGSTQIQVSLSGTAVAGELAIVDHGFAGSMNLPASSPLTIQPPSSGGVYMIRDKTTGAVTAFTNFSAFSTALGNALAQGATLKILGALGAYDVPTNTTQATLVCAVLL